ncbi:MAG: transposase [Clostridiales bacterium]|jgi:REP element-mobilizing transposase RayT|nr:transposase [Clostridiales bacterium]
MVLSRKPRLEFKGAIYHVFQRGNNKEHIFCDPIEKGYFIKQIKDYMSVYNFELFAYVIMDNHYHLILRTNEAALNKIMHSINNVYSKFYNYRHKRTGHVFEERYNSKLVEDDAYLIWLLRYIHRNPVKAHMCDDVSKYKWSSDFFYRKGIKLFVNIDLILDVLSLKGFEAMKKYFQLMESPDENQDYDYEDIKAIFPNISFENDTIKHLRNCKLDRKTLDEIINIMGLGQEEYDLIKSGSRKRHLIDLKLLFIKEALKFKYTHKEIG